MKEQIAFRKKPAALTPMSLKLLRAEGMTVEVVERWNPHARVRQDLFGFVDVLAIGADRTVAVQVCSRNDMSKRRNKITAHANVNAVLAAGWTIEIHGWDKDASGHWRVLRETIA